MKSRQGTLPATIKASKHLVLYGEMSTAITRCSAVDEAKDILDKAVGLAAYYQQVKDTETERNFYRVKLRAWRRIGELIAEIDISGCATQGAKVKKIKGSFAKTVVVEFSDYTIMECLKLATVSDRDFEIALQRITRGSIATFWQHTPQFIAEAKAAEVRAERRRRAEEKEMASPEYQKKLWEQRKQEQEQRKQELEQAALKQQEQSLVQRHINELHDASKQALAEVGITLERKDRAHMKQVVFLIKKEVHTVMRQAAFDKKITMQELLRRGLKAWLIANGYEFPEETASLQHDQVQHVLR